MYHYRPQSIRPTEPSARQRYLEALQQLQEAEADYDIEHLHARRPPIYYDIEPEVFPSFQPAGTSRTDRLRAELAEAEHLGRLRARLEHESELERHREEEQLLAAAIQRRREEEERLKETLAAIAYEKEQARLRAADHLKSPQQHIQDRLNSREPQNMYSTRCHDSCEQYERKPSNFPNAVASGRERSSRLNERLRLQDQNEQTKYLRPECGIAKSSPEIEVDLRDLLRHLGLKVNDGDRTTHAYEYSSPSSNNSKTSARSTTNERPATGPEVVPVHRVQLHDPPVKSEHRPESLNTKTRQPVDLKHVSEKRMLNEQADQVRDAILSLGSLASGAAHKAAPASEPVEVAMSSSPAQQQSSGPSDDISISFAAVDRIAKSFHELSSNFTFPSNLDFTPPSSREPSPNGQSESAEDESSAISRLAYTPNNAPLRQSENSLNSLLSQLDAVESGGNDDLRSKRKEVVRLVEDKLEEIEREVQGRLRRWSAVKQEVLKETREEKVAEQEASHLDRNVDGVIESEAFATQEDQPSVSIGQQLEDEVSSEAPNEMDHPPVTIPDDSHGSEPLTPPTLADDSVEDGWPNVDKNTDDVVAESPQSSAPSEASTQQAESSTTSVTSNERRQANLTENLPSRKGDQETEGIENEWLEVNSPN